ncbi:TetR/AcrR family transcriptional regulator [Maribellus maritimus]|uniref:TetR/AcrR family transcriptional regulator n=1 Tax=Maribellus maritimus TaxID=2870838 RepID=UPI001EEAA68F|nr:TetR/AcrR family transcriptional regulator [Maribellus maritimus]MCG6186668.1 TetR/AcrR family transcriptional regulator [Maribellus maritimus]
MSVTREKILELGENLIRTKGYNAFSYQDISTELGIKNAAIHYYFPSKKNLVTSIVKTNIQRFEEMVENMESRNFDEWQQLDAFVKIYVKSRREKKKCLVGSLSPDVKTLDESTQKELKKMVDMILRWLAFLLERGKNKGVFAFADSAESKAMVIFSSLVASLQLSAVLGNLDYKNYCQSILDDLRP